MVMRIKMLCNWTDSKSLCQEWKVMCEHDYQWNDLEITWEDKDIDYYVIINFPPKDAYYIPEKTIVFQMEPTCAVKHWGEWSNPDPKKFMHVRGRYTEHHNNAYWQMELTLNEIIHLRYDRKLDKLSSICSNKYFEEGHIDRVNMLKYIEEKGGIDIDIYNYDNEQMWKNYRGKCGPFGDKSKGILPYKYYFMGENNYLRNFITEKVWEPILCETLVFYFGCPNIDDYIDKNAIVILDPKNLQESYETILRAIEEDWWSQRIDCIREMKKKILNELAFFPTIEKQLKEIDKIS